MKVAVVGSGIHGSSAARRLAERGHKVVLFERFPLGHSLGSSHGRSRIVRRAYPDAFYTECMVKAYPLWKELERAGRKQILHEVGLLYFGGWDNPQLDSVMEGLKSVGVRHSIFRGAAAQGVLPQIHLAPSEIGVWTAEAGWVDAEQALQATWLLARSAGVEIRENTIVHREDLESQFDRFVLCPGAWIREWVDVPVSVTLQTFGYVQADVTGPVWIEASEDNAYGFPADDRGTKIGIHRLGPPFDLNSPQRPPSPTALEAIKDVASRRFGIKDPLVEGATGCLYTSTANEDFLLGRVGEKGFFASACSGHGFKFGPWIGQLLADFVRGKSSPEKFPRFAWPQK